MPGSIREVNLKMRTIYLFKSMHLLVIFILMAACQPPDFSKLTEVPASFLNVSEKNTLDNPVNDNKVVPLGDILDGSLASKNEGSDFVSTLQYALDTDPKIISARRDIKAKMAVVGVNKAQKDFQVGTRVWQFLLTRPD